MYLITPTSKCNNNCLMCSVGGNQDFEISKSEVDKIIKDIPFDEDLIIINGGEPTLRQDLLEIIKHVREKNKNATIQLLSNGRMFYYEEFVRKLHDLKLENFEIHIPLCGHNSNVHELITQTKESFNQTVKGIKNLLVKNFKVRIIIVVNKINYKFLVEIIDFINYNLDKIEGINIFSMIIVGKAYKNRKDLIVTFEEIKPHLEAAIEKSKYRITLIHFPMCAIPEKYHNLIVGAGHIDLDMERRNFDKNKICFPLNECPLCRYYKMCGGIWSSYKNIVGVNEFKIK